jgi:lysophospholipase L1-like esterase
LNSLKSFILFCSAILGYLLIISLLHYTVNFFLKSKTLKFWLFLIFLAVVIFEISLRLFVPPLKTYPEKIGSGYISMYKAQKNTWYFKHGKHYIQRREQPEFLYVHKANSLGIFAKEPKDINQKKYKILCLGDSFTEGVGAAQNESWPSVLQQKLDIAYPDSFEVINAGIGGSDVFYMWKLYEDILTIYNPDHIIMFIGNSDLSDILVRGGDERFQQDGTIKYRNAPWFEPFFASSYIVRFFILYVMKYDFSLLGQDDFYQLNQQSCSLIKLKLESIENSVKDKNIKFSPIIHPVPYEWERKKFNFQCFEDLMKSKKYNGLNLITTADSLNFETPSNFRPYYWPIDGHYTAKGYELMAEIVFESFYKK